MSFIGDVLGFEEFALKDLGRTIKKDPERLLLGAMDPASSKLWGYDSSPLNMLGGPSSGVYDRAQAAGVSTGSGRKMHDLAEAIAGMYVGNWLGGMTPQSGGEQMPSLPGMQQPQEQPQPVAATKSQDFLQQRRHDALLQALLERGYRG